MNLTTCDNTGASALHIVLRRRDDELTWFLCIKCPELITKASNSGERPIHVVAKQDDAKIVKLLLEHMKDKATSEVNQGDNSGRTAFHFSVEKAAERTGEVLEPCEILFLRAGARLDVADNRTKRTPLHYCFLENASSDDHFNFPHSIQGSTHDRVELASSLLAAEGANESVKMADTFGRTPLFYAAAYNSTVSSLLLLSKGAELFQQDQDKNTPINVAVLRGHDNYTITMLKSVGAASNLPALVDVMNIKREERETDGKKEIRVVYEDAHSIVWHAIKQNFRGLVYILLDSAFPLHRAAADALSHGSFQLVRKLLTTSPIEVVQYVDPDTSRNLLHEIARVQSYANKEWSTTLAEILLSSDIEVATKAKDGQTALHMAATNGHLELVRMFIEKDKAAVLIADNDGHIPLARFMRALPGTDLHELACVEMVSLLTTGIDSLSNPEYNRVPRTKKDEKELEYEGITFRLGPNRETVVDEIEKALDEEAAREKSGIKSSKNDSDDTITGQSTIIIQCLYASKFQVLQDLLKRGAPIDMFDSNGLSPLHHAVLSNSLPATTLLLRNNANPDVELGDHRCLTPLIAAAFQCGERSGEKSKGSFRIAELLIRFGADVMRSCKVTGGTALHFACRENNLELASMLVRAAMHAGSKETGKPSQAVALKDSIVLVRFGQDCALYPGKVQGDKVRIFDQHEHTVPLSLVTESFDCEDLALDSMKRLVELKLEKEEDGSVEKKGKSQVGRGDEKKEDEEMDEDNETDEDEEMIDADGRQGTKEKNRSERIDKAKELLRHYFGLESLLVGITDENVTVPLKDGDSVLVQSPGEKQFADNKKMWLQGRVSGVYNNGTYDIDVYRGSLLKGVVRQHLRPWKGRVTWPSISGRSCTNLNALLETKDQKGHTPLKATIKPVDFGAYERCEMVDLLIENGAKVDATTMSLVRPESEFMEHLKSKSGMSGWKKTSMASKEQKKVNALPGLDPIAHEDLVSDTKIALIELEAKGMMKRTNQPPKINPCCELKANGLRVLPIADKSTPDDDDKAAMHYDVTMAKVELSHYGHSENKYYKMQIVEDPGKGLFVLVTNWGQVGDYGGQKQETPFGSRDEAVTEFCKVFKSKSGNLWEDFASSDFTAKLGKYKPVKILAGGYEKPELPNLAEMVSNSEDYPDVVRKSALPSSLAETMQAFVDPEVIGGAANDIGLQQDQLPLGQISIETILAAEEKLGEVEKALASLDKLHKAEDLKEKREIMEEVAIISSEFFELLPTKEGDNALAPLTKREVKNQKAHILNLKNLTVASSIVNTASVKASETHPLDYAYRSLRANITPLSKDTTERIGIEQYFRNTNADSDLVINQVYVLDRLDEGSNVNLKNHRLLWHGTNVANMMGVIKEGLRIAPPTAMQSGNAFGDGVYFADMVSKSFNYCRASFDIDAKVAPKAYLFLADVALGKQEVVTDPSWGETEMDDSADSVWATGYEGPDVDKDIVFSDSGTVVPLGEVIQNPKVKEKVTWWTRERWGDRMDKSIEEELEAARSCPETIFPTKITTMYKDKPVEIILEHGPHSDVAKVVPVKKRKTKKAYGSKKRRKGDDGEDAKGEEKEEDEGETENLMPEFEIKRKKEKLRKYVHNNEFVVNDTSRINLRYVVEVTSKKWLENQARKARKNTATS